MSQPVWVLSVDLQTKTATFQSGMAEAAKSARGAFTDIKSGSEEMGRSVGSASGSARQSVMLLGDEFGIHLPRGLTMFIASLGPVGPAMEAAFPFVAIALGATLLIQHLAKLKQNGQELTLEQVRFGTAAENAFNALDQKMLQSQIRADELRNDHIGALHKELQLINLQSMAELQHTFGELAKTADAVFAHLQSHWYTLGSGSAGAKHSLDEFTAAYENLLAKGDDKAASQLLADKLKRESDILAMQKQSTVTTKPGAEQGGDGFAELVAKQRALADLSRMHIGNSEDEVKSQEQLVELLNDQVHAEGQLSGLKKQDSSNATANTAKAISAESANAAKAAAESQARINQQVLAADRATADARLTVQRASIESRLASDLAFSDREMQLQLAANQAQIDALSKLANDYPNALKALHEKAAEIKQEALTREAELTAKANVAEAAKSLQDLEQSERQKIEATRQGSEERLAVINSAIKEEESLELQDTSFFRDLMTQRVETTRKAAEEEAKDKADAARLAADDQQKMGEIALAAAKEHQALLDSGRRISIQAQIAEQVQATNAKYALELTAMSQELAGLDKGAKDYENKQREILNRQKQTVQQYENELTAIREKAEMERNGRVLSAEQRFNDTIASGLTQSLMGHKSFAAEFTSIGNTVVTGMMQNAIKSVMANDFTKESDAAAAARKAFLAGWHFPFPANIVAAPVMGAAAFAAMMAFQDGTDSVPGSGKGDKVPAMLEPGEGVVPGGVMDNLRKMASSGEMGGGPRYHVVHSPTYHVQTIDGDGIRDVLDKHSQEFSRHVTNELRRMNH